MVIGELVADKAPFVPGRSDSTVLLARVVAGGAAGAAVFKARRSNVLLGAAVGAAAAIGAAYATHYLRTRLASHFGVSDRVAALVEDGVALGAGLIAVAIAKPVEAEPQVEQPAA